MKFKDKDGNVFEDIMDLWQDWCNLCSREDCEIGDLAEDGSDDDCAEWVESHPAEAARLMGYEAIEDGEAINVHTLVKDGEAVGAINPLERQVKNPTKPSFTEEKVTMTTHPTDLDWAGVQERALVTVGKTPVNPPTDEWKRKMLRCRHSPIRWLRFSFRLEGIPFWVSVHLCRHVHAQPYVRSQRDDRPGAESRENVSQSAPVTMILDMNAEELLTIMNKRLCMKAHPATREVVRAMKKLVEKTCPEFSAELVPMCVYHGGGCKEIQPCFGGDVE